MRPNAFPLFRARFLAATLLTLVCIVPAATAQGTVPAFSCTAGAASSPVLRYEGVTELVGDIVLTCTGGTPTLYTSNITQVNLTVYLNTGVTSRITGNGDTAEALLLVDDPGSPNNPYPLICAALNGCTFPGTSTSTGVPGSEPYNGSPGPPPRPNVFKGMPSGNSVTFFGVPMDAPGTGTRTLRITNIRVNAAAGAAPAATPATIVAQISVTGGISIPITNPQLIVGYVLNGLAFSVRTPDNQAPLGAGGIPVPACTALDQTVPVAVLRFSEQFTTAFKIRAASNPPANIDTSPPPLPQSVLGTMYNTESGFYNLASSQFSTGALADFGTRLKVIFRGIPPGIKLWVTTTNLYPAADAQARLVTGEWLPFAPMPKTDTIFAHMRQLTVTGGMATAVWEVLAANPSVAQSFDFGIATGGVPNPTAPTTLTADGSFAPGPPGADGWNPNAVPRFVDISAPVNLLQTNPCSTPPPAPPPGSVAIMIRPGESPSAAVINPKSHGQIPVAILSAAGFDAPGQVDQHSLRFGRTGAEHSLAFCNPNGEDVNHDGKRDLVCHFQTDLTGLGPGDTCAVLTGLRKDGTAFSSSAPIRTVPKARHQR